MEYIYQFFALPYSLNQYIMSEKNEDVFHLGLTMAGAVSAGCYTAGVMDYLFEILDLYY